MSSKRKYIPLDQTIDRDAKDYYICPCNLDRYITKSTLHMGAHIKSMMHRNYEQHNGKVVGPYKFHSLNELHDLGYNTGDIFWL